MATIIPAIIPTSFDNLEDTIRDVEGFAEEVQIDIVDGKFVPFVSWPYRGSGTPLLLERLALRTALEIDLMIMEPERAIDLYVRAGANALVVHLESTEHVEDVLRHHEEHMYRLGFSINNDTPLDLLTPYLSHIDYVQLMGIAKIGSQGQPFDERVLDRIKELKGIAPERTISIDGSVNSETLPRLLKAGATRFVSGSAILSADDPERAYTTLTHIAERAFYKQE